MDVEQERTKLEAIKHDFDCTFHLLCRLGECYCIHTITRPHPHIINSVQNKCNELRQFFLMLYELTWEYAADAKETCHQSCTKDARQELKKELVKPINKIITTINYHFTTDYKVEIKGSVTRVTPNTLACYHTAQIKEQCNKLFTFLINSL